MKNLISVGTLYFALANLGAKDLYVVMATTSAHNNWRFGSAILKVAGTLTPAAAIFSIEDGNRMILINPQDRWLAAVSFMPPRKLALMNLDKLDKIHGFAVSDATSNLFSANFVRDPTMGLRFAGIRSLGDSSGGRTEVVRFQLSSAEPSLAEANPPGEDDFRFAEVTGTSGLAGLGYTDQILARVDPTNKTALIRGMNSDFPLPPSLVANNDGLDLLIQVKNRDLVVLREGSHKRGSWVRDPDCVWYLNRASKQWYKVLVSGEPEIRGFGHWFAITERLTTKAVKRERKAKKAHPKYSRLTGPDIDHVFENFEFDGKPWNYTGVFRILDGSSDGEREWILETGNENSEVLLIEGQTLVYRIEDSIWEATLDVSGKITGTRKICTDPRILDAHWAFFSDWTPQP